MQEEVQVRQLLEVVVPDSPDCVRFWISNQQFDSEAGHSPFRVLRSLPPDSSQHGYYQGWFPLQHLGGLSWPVDENVLVSDNKTEGFPRLGGRPLSHFALCITDDDVPEDQKGPNRL